MAPARHGSKNRRRGSRVCTPHLLQPHCNFQRRVFKRMRFSVRMVTQGCSASSQDADLASLARKAKERSVWMQHPRVHATMTTLHMQTVSGCGRHESSQLQHDKPDVVGTPVKLLFCRYRNRSFGELPRDSLTAPDMLL